MMRYGTGFLFAILVWLGSVAAQPPSPAPPIPRPWLTVAAGGAYGETATVSLKYGGAGLPFVLAASTVHAYGSTPPLLPPIALLSVANLRQDGTAAVPVAVPKAPQLAGVPFHLMAWVHDPGWKMWMQSDVCTWVIAHPTARRFVPASTALSYSAGDGHARALLADGRVLFCGGSPGGCVPTLRQDARVYDPARKVQTTVGNMTVGRIGHVAVPLPTGKVLVVGGDSTMSATAELFDPATSSFRSVGAVPVYLNAPFAVPIRDPGTGRHYVLIGGGWTSGGAADAAMLYDVTAGKMIALPRMGRKRVNAAAVALPQFGAVLITGGHDLGGRAWRDAEMFYLPTRRFYAWGGLTSPRAGHAMVMLDASHAVVLGGGPTPKGSTDIEVFDALTGNAVRLPIRLATRRYDFETVRLADGSLLIGGGNRHESALPGRTPEILTGQGPTVLRPIASFSPAIELQALRAGGAMAIGAGATFDLR